MSNVFSLILGWVESLPPPMVLTVIVSAGVAGILLGTVSKLKKFSRLKDLEKSLAHAEKRIESLKQSKSGIESAMDSLKSQNQQSSSFISLLPDAVEKLNTSEKLDDLLNSLVRITERLLQAREVSVFLRQRDVLILKASSPDRKLPETDLTIRIGEGKIGWVAQKGITMTDHDLELESNLVKKALSEDEINLRTKICSPMVYQGKILGVINIGSCPRNQEQELRVARMITALGSIALGNVMLKKQIQSGSDKDALTGVYSIQYFLNELRKELSKARRYKRPLSLCLFSIDSFQQYNEKNGYLSGDEVLRMMSKILKDHLREHDMVARYGGKEFILICPETAREDAAYLAEKLGKIIEESPFPHKERMPGGKLTVSGGVSGYPEDGTDEGELIRQAVEAARTSKASGRNRVSKAGDKKETGKISGKFTIR